MTTQVQENKNTYGKWQPRTLYYWLARIGSKTSWTILTIVIFNVICYASTIDGYFLADDFIHVSYLYKVFNGHPALLLENFWSNWMQTEGTQFYRPIISLTLAFDYMFWAENAKGYHLSNLVYQILCSIGVFLVTKRVFITDLKGQPSPKKKQEPNNETKDNSESNSNQSLQRKSHSITRLSPDHVYTINFSALLASLIFSVHPLHPEVVSWVIGRVDSVCTAAYLFAMWLFLVSLQSNSSKVKTNTKIASLFLFAISLGSKEMAVTLPPSLVLLLLFFQTPVYGRANSIWVRITNAFRATWLYWLVLIVYLLVRTLSLGAFVGGYGGSIGEGFSSSILERLISQRSIYRVIFPLNMEVFSINSRVIDSLRILYSAMIGTFVLALLISRSKATVIKSVIFTGLWFVLIMIPTIPVWNLTDSLQSSRFIYMGTVPLSILLAILVCPLSRYGRRVIKQREKTNFTLRITQDTLKGLSALIAILFVVTFTSITIQNNSSWAKAGHEVKTLRAQVYNKINRKNKIETIGLLNLPNKYKGAHMIYNGAMMQVLMTPPLSNLNLQNNLLTFEPAMFGDSDLIRASRLRNLVQSNPGTPIYKWNRESLKLERVRLSTKSTNYTKNLEFPVKVNADSVLISPSINVSTLSTDFIELDIAVRPVKTKAKTKVSNNSFPLVLYWLSQEDESINQYVFLSKMIDPGKKNQTIRFHTSQHKKWIKASQVKRVVFSVPHKIHNVEINSIRCLKADQSIPLLKSSSNMFSTDVRGVFNIGPDQLHLPLSFDTSKIGNASKSLIEVSQPNSWFEHYSGSFRDKKLSDHSLFTKEIDSTIESDYKLSLAPVKTSGFYQVRIIGIGADGNTKGYFSDPLVLQVSR